MCMHTVGDTVVKPNNTSGNYQKKKKKNTVAKKVYHPTKRFKKNFL
jgi:hypothetical protein